MLEGLGIAWHGGSRHITCPYPDHADDNPSWRWNAAAGRAHCTCIERSHSIFDVVMRCESIEFEAAKLRVAEILGRHDLIKVRDGERHQATDAASLLRPPPISATTASGAATSPIGSACPRSRCRCPRPASSAGLARLLRPAGRRSRQAKLVGHYPCVVFATAGAGRAAACASDLCRARRPGQS